ncbi:MAG: CDP-alcohol phosphatidyltransferase family protein [Actinomycetota bacterium]|nr:CDP-alcohol phosphatidyltransferase family protein [Actinomycetota bacterium]
MIDNRARKVLNPLLERAVTPLFRMGVKANAITTIGFGFGLASIVSISMRHNLLALALWLANRLFDGIDGVLARKSTPTDLGGFLDIVFDFVIYGGLLVGIAFGYPNLRLESIILLGTYYVSGTALLALSSITERRARIQNVASERSSKAIRFIGGLAEGGETIIFYVVVMALPQYASIAIGIFIAMVAITAFQRIAMGVERLSGHCTPKAIDACRGESIQDKTTDRHSTREMK